MKNAILDKNINELIDNLTRECETWLGVLTDKQISMALKRLSECYGN